MTSTTTKIQRLFSIAPNRTLAELIVEAATGAGEDAFHLSEFLPEMIYEAQERLTTESEDIDFLVAGLRAIKIGDHE